MNMIPKDNYKTTSLEASEKVDLKEYFEKYFTHWRWFFLSISVSIGIAFLFLKYEKSQFRAEAYIMIKDNLKSGISDELKAVSDLGIVGTSSTNNPANEIFIIKSRKIVGRMVDSLGLTVRYFKPGNIRDNELYKNNCFKLEIVENSVAMQNLDTSFLVSNLGQESLQIKNLEGELLKKVSYNQIISIGNNIKFRILENHTNCTPKYRKEEIKVVVKPRYQTIDTYKSRIKAEFVDENSSVLALSINDEVRAKAENILNELIKQYNMDAVMDKNVVSNKTKYFIDERLRSIAIQLGVIQDDLKEYKTKFGISGSPKEGSIALEEDSQNNKRRVELKTKLSLIDWVLQEISGGEDNLDILPTNLGFEDVTISRLIENYNKLILEKLRLERNAGIDNPNLLNLISQAKGLNTNLIKNFLNFKKSLEIQLDELNKTLEKVQNQVSSIPEIERGIIDIQRRKFIYGELYSYLLKKKEETAISLAITVPNAKIIDAAYGSKSPVFPRKNIVYFIGLISGILVPFVFLYFYYELNTKIHTRKDIERELNIPYIGDIPNSQSEEKIIITKGSRTSTSEAFRLLRTNLKFLLNNKKKNVAEVIFVTSTISGEGKSFISINLASTLALTGSKILLMGLDLRSPKITEYLKVDERKGVTNYILNSNITIQEIKFTLPQFKNIDFISSGLIPPNPSELLFHERVNELFEVLKKEYDYIVADTAPVSLVTDTLMIADQADLFLYVARANYLEKKLLMIPETLYREKKLPNMAILLNDTNYKIGYGYGYGFVEEEKRSRLRRFIGF